MRINRIIQYPFIFGIFFLSFINCFQYGVSQDFTISGSVEDISSGERLIGANVYVKANGRGSVSNAYGYYSHSVSAGAIVIKCSYIGYKSIEVKLLLENDTIINFNLRPTIDLEEVTIAASQSRSSVLSTQLSMNELSAKTIQKLPVFMGEKDVLKTLQLLPGVQSGNEGTSGFYVRGGGPDQNLILLDGVPVYNVNHLFGFFSVFNPDAIQNVKLVKGGFPARYGGRLSSVLDIRLKEGNNKKFAARGSIGLISSKLTIEGPISKGKTSFIVSGRRTYIDVLAQPLIKILAADEDVRGSTGGYYFYDLSAKINHRFSDRSRLYLSTYLGKDKANIHIREHDGDATFREDFGLVWGNATTALRWNYILSPKLFCNSTLTYSDYNFLTEMGLTETVCDTTVEGTSFSYNSGIRDLTSRIDFDLNPHQNHAMKFGLNYIFHTFSPGVTVYQMVESPALPTIETSFGGENIFAGESALYIEDEWKIGSRVKLNLGLHGSAFSVDESVYFSLQPRVSGMFLINENWSVKGAYSQMAQHIHLLTNSTIGLPTDLWVPSTAYIKPQKSVQYTIGSVFESPAGWKLSLEGYYKSMDNLIEYKEGSSFFSVQDDWQDKITFGRGKSFGMEFFLRKSTGNTTGWIGYTLSKTSRQFVEISFGEWFPYRYDRRHDLSIVLNHKINERIDMGLTWFYGTGNAITLPYESYQFELWPGKHFATIDQIENRNSHRMPAYHRLDIGVNIRKEKKWGTRTLSFGLYNAYNRQNPLYINTMRRHVNLNTNQVSYTQYSLFPIIPSISYSFNIK